MNVKRNILDNQLYKKYYPITSQEDCDDFLRNHISYIRKTLRNFERNLSYMGSDLTEKYTKKIKDPLTAGSINSAIKRDQRNQQILLDMELDLQLQKSLSEIDQKRNIVMKLQQKIFDNNFAIEDCNLFLNLVNNARHYQILQFLCMTMAFMVIAIILFFFTK